MLKISIILPVYNVEKYLEECLNSLINQNYNDYEIILVNDGSKDNSFDICCKYSKLYTNIRVFDKENGGVSSARNLGIEKAKGKFLFFVDPDDIITPFSLLELDKILNDENLLYVFSHKKIYKNCEENVIISNNIINKEQGLRDLLEEDKFCGYVWNKTFSSKIIEQYNIRFDTNISMNEDMKFCFDYLNHCNGVYCFDKVIYGYRCRESSVMNTSIGKKNATSVFCYKYILDNSNDSYIIDKCKSYYLKSYYKYRKFVEKDFFDINLVKNILKCDYNKFKLSEMLKINMYRYVPQLRKIILKIKNINKISFE